MKNRDPINKIQNSNRNSAIKIILVLFTLILISIEIGKDFYFRNTNKSYNDQVVKINRLKLIDIEASKELILFDNSFYYDYLISVKFTDKMKIITEHNTIKNNNFTKQNTDNNIEIQNDMKTINADYQLDKKNRRSDIDSYFDNTPYLSKVVLGILSVKKNDFEIPEKLNSTESSIQGMTISQQGNFNVAVQTNVRGIGQVQYIQQIGSYNNNINKAQNRKELINDDINSLDFMVKPILLTSNFNDDNNEINSIPISQFSNQKYGKAVMKVLGNENNTYQNQEYYDQKSNGYNEVYMTIKGDKNDLAQGQLGLHNISKLYVSGNENYVTNCQYGELNYSGITITAGFNNNVNVDQIVINNFVVIHQNSENSTIKVHQDQY